MNRCKTLGKIKKRLEEAKNKWSRLSKPEFCHNESARVATDALLDGGSDDYHKVLTEEGEVDFLSKQEVQYILDNVKQPYYANESLTENGENGSVHNGNHSHKSESFYPTNSDKSETTTPLHNWSSEEKPYLKDKSSATVYFQTDKTNNIRETVRRSIHRTGQVIAIMMDEFTDAEIFCDILEAANKRNVFVYLLLDVSKLQLFMDMCEKLQVKDVHLKNISVRSVSGEVYCAKSGKKFFGQIHEKFIISDWRFVLSGSYSFTWLSGQVHRNFLTKFTGHVVELFDEEFRHLYDSSKPVMGLKSPAPMKPVLRREGSAMSTMTDSSTQETTNTTSDLLSSSPATSISQLSLCPSSPSTPTPSPTKSPLQRMNSFHGYTALRSPPPQTNYQVNYYQRSYVPESPTQLFSNNNNIYRSMRTRREDFTPPSRFTQGWRFFSKPTMT
ncbi:protein FAM83A [Bufo gargarizans]|uniref:protein FAM83A n=1 Tax=Bufo gargarizans TaxID=30331 RepID=UPI001CF0E17E|nr:protein FAM83A [Bufo gargarizans]